MFPAVRDSSEAALTSAAGAMMLVLSALPRMLAATIIVVAGWYLGRVLAAWVARLFAGVHFAQRPAPQPLSLLQHPAQLLALAAKWLVRLLALFVAVSVAGLPAVTEVLHRMLLWLPQLAVGVAVLVVGGYLANAAAAFAAGAARSAGLRNPGLVAGVAHFAVWAFAAIIALHEIGVGYELVYTLFAGAVALAAVVGGLALGLGAQDMAAGLVARWYGASRGAVGRISVATDERKERREFDVATLARRWRQMGLSGGARLQASHKRVDLGRIPEDEVFKELTVEAAQMAQELVIAKHPRVVDELRVRVDVFEHEDTVRATVRDIDASIEFFRAPAHERRKSNGSYSGLERRRRI